MGLARSAERIFAIFFSIVSAFDTWVERDELVPAESPDDVRLATGCPESTGERQKQLVPRQMSERVVGVFQAVGIEQRDNEDFLVAERTLQRNSEQVLEVASGEEPGEGVDMVALDIRSVPLAGEQAHLDLSSKALDNGDILRIEDAGSIRIEIERAKESVAHEEGRTDDRLEFPVARFKQGDEPREILLSEKAGFP